MNIPTREQLGLPWTCEDGCCIADDNKGQSIVEVGGDGAAEGTTQQLAFACHAANTYHEREKLLRECLEFVEANWPIKSMTFQRFNETLVARLHTALKV